MPKRPRGFDYQAYLASREWAVLRERVRSRSRNVCEHCMRAPQEAVHHLTYARIGHEELSDLMAVCNACHEYFSGKSDVNPGAWYVPSPALELPVFKSQAHLLVPRPYMRLEQGKYRIEAAPCVEGCVWCGRVEIDWIMYIEEFVLLERTI